MKTWWRTKTNHTVGEYKLDYISGSEVVECISPSETWHNFRFHLTDGVISSLSLPTSSEVGMDRRRPGRASEKKEPCEDDTAREQED